MDDPYDQGLSEGNSQMILTIWGQLRELREVDKCNESGSWAASAPGPPFQTSFGCLSSVRWAAGGSEQEAFPQG